uniref:Uncharacterized protein n=1 Tax=Romanomermis culicivorax TaxID=13658 RepID=A0A915IA59_ROMCU
MIGILCTLVNSEPQDYGKRGSYQVDDIFFGMLDSNAGFKSLTITKDETNGKKLVLIHNFFFKRKLSDVHNRGLTERERKKINSKLLNDDYDQKIVEYLVFDLNTNKSSGEKCDLRVPFVERITDAGESNETAGDQVENFKSLRGLLKIPFDLLRKIPNFEHHDIGMIYYQIFENFIGWKISLVQSVGFKATSQFALPIASVVLAIHDIRSAVESYRSGDHSALAVFNIVSSSVSLATSLMSLAINVISVAVASSTFLSAFSTAIFVVGTLFYYAGHVWKAYIHIEGINEKIGLTGWEKAVEYMGSISGRGINPKFGNLDLVGDIRAIKEHLGYVKERTGYKPGNTPLTKDLEETDGTDYMSTFFCTDAFGISRQNANRSPEDITQYWLHGNSTVYASSDTINVFQLSGGEKCTIFGGQKANTFVLASEFKQGVIEGSELEMDVLILAFTLRGTQPRFILGKGDVVSAKRIKTTVSEVIIKYIDKIIIGSEVEYDDVHIFCDLKTVVVTGNKKIPTKILLTGEDCRYDLTLMLREYVNVTSIAKYGKINYKFDSLTVFHIGSEDQQSVKIKCNSGYNAVLVSPTNLTATITEDESEWFKLVNVEVEQDTEALTVDLTLVTDTFDQLNELYYLHIDSSVNNSSILLDVHVTIQNDEKTTSYKIGSIDLHGIMIDDKYKKVKVSAKSDFIFEADDNYKTWRLIPSPRVISPFSPIVVLDPFVVEKNQTILFDSRVMNNYDVVELDDSTLLITNMASDMIKSLILTAQSVPLLTIIIEDYKSERMRDVRLKFEQDVEIDLINLDGRRIISYDVFQMKINLMSERINEEGLILRHDRRFQRSKTQSIYCSPWVIMPQWKSTDNSLPFVMNDMTCTK